MSPETERIQVPTNGKGPHPFEEPPPADEMAETEDAGAGFTPAQLAVGFGIIASLLLLLAGWLRGRGRSPRR